MAPEALTKEQLAKVRRVMLQRPLPSPDALAQSAARTPNITRFIIAKQKKLGKLRSEAAEASPLSTSMGGSLDGEVRTCNQQVFSSRVEEKAQFKSDEIKTSSATSRQPNNRHGAGQVHPFNLESPHTLAAFRPAHERRLKVKVRRDIYDLSEDDSGFTAAALRMAASNHKIPAVDTSYAEPRTSSFCYPDSPSSPESQESRAIEECLKIARQAPEVVSDEGSQAPSQNPALVASGTGATEKKTREAQEFLSKHPLDSHLTKLDLGILHLGENNYAPPSIVAPSLYSPKRARSSAERQDIYDYGFYANDADGESDADFEEPLPKRRRRSSSQVPRVEARNAESEDLNSQQMSRTVHKYTGHPTKSNKVYGKSRSEEKKKRRLPVGKLISVPERPENSDVEETDSRPAELSQDPISQLSDEHDSETTEIEHHRPSLRLKINIRPRKRIEAVDMSLFRVPKPRSHSQISRRGQQFTPPYSDGFEGKEAEPTGIYMPVKRPARQRESYQKVTIRLGELAIVSERPFEEIQIEPCRHPRRNQGRRKANATPSTHSDLENDPAETGIRKISAQSSELKLHLLDDVQVPQDEDNMVVDGQQGDVKVEAWIPRERRHLLMAALQEQTTPRTIMSDGQMSETPAHLTSPLEHKQSAVRDARITIDNLQEAESEPSQRPAESITQTEAVEISAQLLSAMKKTPTRTRTESLEVEQELMMVSVQKRPIETNHDTESTDDEGDYERESAESYSNSDSNDENSSEEENQELTPGEDSDLDEESEEEASQELRGDGATENIGPDNCLVASVRAVPVVPRQKDAESDGPEASTAAEAEVEQKLPHSDHEFHKNRGGTSLDTAKDLQHIDSQALQLDIPAQSQSSFQLNVSLPDNDRSRIKGIAASSRGSQQNQFLPTPAHSKHPDSSWRPRIPNTTGLAVESEEEIVDSPSPAPLQNRKGVRLRSSRRQSAFGSQLTMVRSRRNSPLSEKESLNVHNNTQESVVPGDSRRTIRSSPINIVLESHFRNNPDSPETQLSFVPQPTYMERAIGQLSQSPQRSNLTRTKSTPAHVYFTRQEGDGNTMMAGGITMTSTFQHTASLLNASQLETLLEEKSLRALTRQTSLSLETMPGSAKKRTVPLQFNPPFKK